jgi:hypothetical protein
VRRILAPSLALAAVALAACDAAEGVRVQPLPSLERPSPEARAGLPEVAGEWRFAGWELAPDDSARLDANLPQLGTMVVETQRLDSIGGAFLTPGARFPLIGEVRRDGIVSLVSPEGPAAGRYLAGRVRQDTLWISLTTFVDAAAWPDGARAAFVRTPVTAHFARLEGQRTVLPEDTLPPPVLAGPPEMPPVAAPGEPGTPPPAGTPPAAPPTAPAAAAPTAPPAAPAATPQRTAPVAAPQETPERTAPAEPARPQQPAPEARPAPPPADPPADTARRAPRLLGEPIRPDPQP